MSNYSVKRILKKNKEIELPDCTFCRSKCYQCKYYMWEEGRDSKGHCRCSYHGTWHYGPNDGCGNGVTIEDDQKETAERLAKMTGEIDYSSTKSGNTYTNQNVNGGFGASSGFGGFQSTGSSGTISGGGAIVLLIIGAVILFNTGILKPTISFEMEDTPGSSEQYTDYSLNVIRMDDGSNVYPKNFKGYKADSGALDEYGNYSVDLKKGEYNIWLSHDGVSGFAGSVDVSNIFDEEHSINSSNVERGAIHMATLFIRNKSGDPVVDEDLMISDEYGNQIICTSYDEDGRYVLLIPDSNMTQEVVNLTIQVKGYQENSFELDFSKSRITDIKIKLTEK